MDRLLARVVLLVWGAWFGGLLGVFLAVTTVFAALDPDRATAGVLGAAIFHRAERLILVAAALSLVGTLGLLLRQRRPARYVLLTLFAVATLLALANTLVITPRIDRLREARETDTPAFRQAHGLSMGLYSAQTLVLGLTGVVLPAALRRPHPEPA
ncbi:MAG: DUF4149 domain-containing protein [Tepidisphaerales bacterium]